MENQNKVISKNQNTNSLLKVDNFIPNLLKTTFKVNSDFPEEIFIIILSYIPLDAREIKFVCKFFGKHYYISYLKLQKEFINKLTFPFNREYEMVCSEEELMVTTIEMSLLNHNSLSESLKGDKTNYIKEILQVKKTVQDISCQLGVFSSSKTFLKYVDFLKYFS